MLDKFIAENNLKIIKEFPHKRAFSYKEVMVELFLVQDGITNFFSMYKHIWPENTFKTENIGNMRVCSIESLKNYREKHHFVEKASRAYFK